jgi:hypothetical protein
MKQSKTLTLLKHLQTYRCFTVKDVVRWTQANNPYRVIEELKKHIDLQTQDVRNEDVKFRVYYITRRAALDLIRRRQWVEVS